MKKVRTENEICANVKSLRSLKEKLEIFGGVIGMLTMISMFWLIFNPSERVFIIYVVSAITFIITYLLTKEVDKRINRDVNELMEEYLNPITPEEEEENQTL